jgi:hypothetical protein
VETAFLHADVEEEIYVRLPEGMRTYDKSGQEKVAKLNKSLYGLKQAPREWNKLLTKTLLEYGFSK